TAAQMGRALSDFSAIADKSDVSFVYYTGHGFAIDGDDYIVPVDANLADAKSAEIEAIPVGRLISAAQQARRIAIIAFDACRNNPFLNLSVRGVHEAHQDDGQKIKLLGARGIAKLE